MNSNAGKAENIQGRGTSGKRMEEAHGFFFTPPCTETNKAQEENDLLALEPTGAYSTSKKTLVSDMMERVVENERVEGWKEQLREEKKEGGVDLRRQNMVRGRAERDNSGAGLDMG